MDSNVKKVYISLPISGRDEAKQRRRAEMLAERIRQAGMEPVNPFEIADELRSKFDVSGGEPTWYDYMSEDIYHLLQCDGILLDLDAKKSYGCSIEAAIAKTMVESKGKEFTVYHTREQWGNIKKRYIL